MLKQPIVHICVIAAVAAAIFFTSLGRSRLWDRDEPRNAGCAAEMMQQGNYVVPIFNDELRHQKPVLLYWLMIASYSVFGVNEFAARFPSAILGLGSVLLTYLIGRRLFDSKVGLLAAIALSSSVMFCVAARAATPDSVLIFFSTLGIYGYVLGTFLPTVDDGLRLRTPGHWFPQKTRYVIAMNVAFALGVLAKGPVAVVLPTAIIGMFLLIQRLPQNQQQQTHHGRLAQLLGNVFRVINPVHFFKTCWYMRPITAITTVLIISAPWYVAVAIATDGDFTRLFFLNENFARATTVMENHSGSWLYYPATIAVGFFPWSVFLGPVLFAIDHQISRKTKNGTAMTLLVCWVAVQVGLFSLAETKLPSYITPCYPALALLTAFCIVTWLPQIATAGVRWHYAAMGALVLSGLILIIGLGIAAGIYFPQIWWIATLGLIPVAGGGAAIYLHFHGRMLPAITTTTLASVLFCWFMFGIGTVAVDSARQTEAILADIKSEPDDIGVATYHCLESSWVFYAERPLYELFRGNRSLNIPTSLERSAYWKKKPTVTPEDFYAAKPEAMFLTTDEHVEELLQRLPARYEVVSEAEFFLKPDRKLVLLKKTNQQPQMAADSTKLPSPK